LSLRVNIYGRGSSHLQIQPCGHRSLLTSTMSGLKFNFNKPKVPEKKAAPAFSKTAFDDDADEDNVFTQSKSSTTSSKKKRRQPEAIVNVNQDLRNYTSLSEETAARMAKEALEEDPSVFAYDDVYDDLKAVERQKKAIAEQQRLERKVRPIQKVDGKLIVATIHG
jgi:coiled-coil domain-containing protein 55